MIMNNANKTDSMITKISYLVFDANKNDSMITKISYFLFIGAYHVIFLTMMNNGTNYENDNNHDNSIITATNDWYYI